MKTLPYDCECVVAMEEMGVGSEEVIQYARAVLSRREITHIVRGLEGVLRGQPIEENCADTGSAEYLNPVADAVSDHAI